MAEDNKLVFPIGFNIDEGVEKIKQAFETLQKAALKWSELISNGGSAKEIQKASRSLKAAVKGTTESVKALNDVELSNVQTKSKMELATKKVAKAEIDLEVATKKATNAINISNKAAASYADIATNKTAKSAAELAKANINVEIATNKASKSAADLTRANASAQLAQMRVAKASETQNKHFKTQSGLLMQLKGQIGAYASIYALQRFAKQVRDITGEFELQRVSLTAILQDKAAADKIFGQVVELAIESPFRIKDIISYTKQLAAYRVETDKLFDTTKRLADISAGLGVDMDRLVLAYGQVRAASVLRGQELRQFTEAGIPLVKLLADKFTELRGVMVSTGEVFELISKRAVPFRMIEEIFNDMTNAGGIFYNMQKTQAKTVYGVWMNLKDAYDKMYNEIGQANMGLLKGLGNFLRSLADNWRLVYNGLSTVTAGYVAYIAVTQLSMVSTKSLTAAQLANIAADGKAVFTRLSLTLSTKAATKASDLYMLAQYRLKVSTNLLSKAFWKLTAAIASNPIAAIVGASVVALTAIGFAIAKIVKYQTEYEKSVEKLKNKESELSSSRNDELLKLDILYKRLDRAKEGSEEYMAVRDEISSKYGLYLKDLKDEAGNVIELKDAYEQLASKILEAARSRAKTELLNLISEETVNAQKKIFDKIDKILEDKYGKIQGDEYARRIKISLMKGDEFDEEIKGIISGFNKVSTIVNQEPSLLEMLVMGKDTRGSQNRVENILDSWMNTFKKTTNDYKELIDDVESDFPDVDVIPKVIEESLAGLKKYVFELESLEKRAGGNKIKLYDAEEDIKAFTTETDLLDDIAKKYKEAATEAEHYAKKKNNLDIGAAERMSAANSEKEYNAEMKLAYSALARYDALNLISDFLKKNSKSEVDVLYDQIKVAKEARAAYDGYLKSMTEARAKQTVESQLKFAGLEFDVSDSGSYKEYLQNVYNKIKNDPNYDKVRQLIEDVLVDFDVKAVETALKNKLDKIASDISKTQKANEFFEKMLGLTGDIELSKKLTIKYTGTAAGDTAKDIKEQLQTALNDVLGKDTMDISAMSVKEISDLIDTIPETMSEKKTQVRQFFENFVDGGKDAAIKMVELDNVLKELNLDDSMLFGTGVTLDVQKIVRDLSVGNKKLADEKKRLEEDVRNDARAKDKTWLREKLMNIDRAFRQQAANDKTLAQDKLNDLAKAYVEERLFQDGISELLQDVGDKTYSQLSRARKMLQSISDTELIKISDEGMDRIESLGYTVDDLMKMESLEKVFSILGEDFSYADEQLISLLFNMNRLGLSAEDVEKLIGEILSGKVSNARVEELKKLSSTVNELSSGIAGILNDSLNLFAGDAPWIDGVQKAIDGFAKLTSAAVELGSEISRAAGELGEATSTIGGGVAAGGGGIAGAIIAIVGAVIQIGAAIAQLVQSIKQSRIEGVISRVNKEVDVLVAKIEAIGNIKGIADGWFTEDNFQKIKNYNEQINKVIFSLLFATNNYNKLSFAMGGKISETAESLRNITKTLGDMFGTYFKTVEDLFYDAYPDLDEDIAKFLMPHGAGVTLTEQLKDIMNFDDIDFEKLAELKLELESLIFDDKEKGMSDLRDSIIAQIELLEDAYKNIKSIVNNILGDISGTMLDAVIEQWDLIREKGIDAFGGIEGAASHMAESVKKDVAGMIKDMVAQQLWAATMSKYFDTLGEDLTQAILGGASPTDMLPIFNTFWEGMKEGLVNYTTAWDAFLNTAEAAGWNMRGGDSTADDFAPGSISELNDQLSKLEKQWDNMSQAEREAAAGLQLWNNILAKREEVEAAESYYEYANKLDEAVGKYDDLIEKATYLKSVVDSLAEGGEKKYAQSLLDQTNAEIYASLYSEYLPDTVKFNDEIATINKNLQWAIENGYPELAEWIRKAYDTKVLDKWEEAVDEKINGADSDLQKFDIVVKMLRDAEAELLNTIMNGGDAKDATNHIAYLQGVLSDLRKSLKDGIWSDYATDAQKYEQELVDMNKDLEWAIRNYPELANEISDAFNTSVLKNWQDAWDDAFEDFDTSFQKWQAIQQELGNLGTPNITKDEVIRGRDAALVEMGKYKEGTSEYAAAKSAYDYYQAQLLLHMKINELLIQQADIEDELYDKYRSGEQEYADDIAEREADIKTLEGIRDSFAPDTKEWEKWNDVVKNAQKELREFVSDYNLDGLTEEFDATFGDITDLSTKKVKEMLEAFRAQILSSDLSEEAKKEALALIDDIYDELDSRTQEAFDNIQSAINSLSSILESFGADENIINSFKGIESAIGGVAQIVTGVASGNWFIVLAGIAKLISGFISSIKSLIKFFKGDPLAGLEAIAATVTNAQNVVEKAIGTAKAQEQKKLVDTYAQAMAQIDEAISSESGKKDTWWTRLWGTAPDDEAIEKLKEQRAEYEKLMEEVKEAMKSDFLQTDYISFSDALADILIKPWDSYVEMMDAVRELTNNTINDIVRHALSLQLQQKVNEALNSLYARGISNESLDQFDADIENIVSGYAAYQEALGKYFNGDTGSSTAYDTISRITEAQANSFLGYYQNYLIIMTDMSNVLKRIFDSMNKMAVSVNLDGYLNTLQAIATNTALTAQHTSALSGMAADIKQMKNALTRSGAY